MISTTYNISPRIDAQVCSPDADGACGLEYATVVLERGGIPDALSKNEAPRLVEAAGGRIIAHSALQAQIDDAARVVATDASSRPLLERLRNSTNALADPPREPISNSLLNTVATIGSILGLALGVLPLLGIVFSPWITVGVFAVSLGAFLAQLFNQSEIDHTRKRAVEEQEDAIVTLLQRAEEIRAQLARQATQSIRVTPELPGARRN